MKKGKGHPLCTAHEYIMINEGDNIIDHKENDISNNICSFNII